jgi:homoserine dehydrogenase
MGYRGSAPSPDDLVPPRLRKLPLDAFMARLSEVDDDWRTRVAQEAARGRVLRYVVTATPRGVSAKLTAVPVSSPVGSLQGTRNLVAFTTRRYLHEPLVVSGPGAGAEVTAAGILNDIYALATT